jgi:tape measure domain-containing protein
MSLTNLLMIGLGVDTRRLRDGERALGSLQKAGNRAENALGRMATTLASVFAVHKIIEYADAYTSLQNKLKLVTNSTTELGYATDEVANIAKKTGQALGATGDLYFKISQNTEKLGVSMTDVSRITETFAKTLAISGSSTQGAEAAILQFGQALASGVIRGDEFNSVAENAPAALDAFARALGVPKGELRKLAAEGMLTSDILISALQEQSQVVDDLYAKTDTTIGQASTKLKNSMILFVGQLDTAVGASKSLVSSLEGISNWLDSGTPLENTAYQFKLWGYAIDDASSATVEFLGYLGLLKKDGGDTASFLADAFTKLPINVASSFKIARIEVKSFFDYVKEGLIISAERWNELDKQRKDAIADILAERDARLGAGDAAVKAIKDERSAREALRKQKELDALLDDWINESTRKSTKDLFEERKKQLQAEKDAENKKKKEAKDADQLQEKYKSLLLSAKERVELWGNESELAKLNFDLQNTELSKLLPAQKELLQIQYAKIDALKAEEEAKTQQQEVDNFMAQQAQELDALRQSYATKNEIVNQAYLQREAIIQRGIARGAILENEAAILRKQNEQQAADERVAIAKEEEDRKRQIELERLQNMSQLFGNLATLMQTENRKLFEIGKAAAIAQAIVNTATAITNALAVPPFPLGFALAATAGVAGAVQIATIQNQQMKGARAMGGDVQAGNSYLVGERGPEVVTMGGNGHVTPNHKLGSDTKVTIVNQTTGKIDKVEERRMPDGELILTVIEAVAAQTLDPNSKISRNQAAAFGLQRRR